MPRTLLRSPGSLGLPGRLWMGERGSRGGDPCSAMSEHVRPLREAAC